MRQRNSTEKIWRSSRFLQQSQPDQECPKTPNRVSNKNGVTSSSSRGVKDDHSTRIANIDGDEAIQKVPFGCSDKKAFSGDGIDKVGANLPREPISESENIAINVPPADLVGGEHLKGGVEAEKNQVGAKRKKIQVREEHTMLQGWTAEQELALEELILQRSQLLISGRKLPKW
ncbi:hypothetical protein ACH5RR_013913 [Cinchona calisaya]|uniref:Uncharacterized protein n=1 Tax=Cinchona calisaya TaxID=153742 RepID=A0ABD3A1E7_9GENT